MKDIERRKFLGASIGLLGLASLYDRGKRHSISVKSKQQGKIIRLKGKDENVVTHWDIITIGNLSRNRYWGESDEKALHSVICTCSVISGSGFHMIIDPSLADERAMITELQRRTGLAPDKINAVFITHQHGDHVVGLKHFPKARWFAGADVAAGLNKSAKFGKQIEAAGNTLFGTIDVIPTPGHTSDHQSLRFDYRGLSIVISGDAIVTKDFWDEKRAYYNVMDEAASRRSMANLDSLADIIVPGHDNAFFNI